MLHRWKILLSGLLIAFGCKAKSDAAERLIVTEVKMVRPAAERAPVVASAEVVPIAAPGVDSVQEQAEFCRQVERQALDTNASLPKRLDQDTSATRVVAYGCDVVLEYEQPQLDPKDEDGKKLIKDGKLLLEGGYIALQAESHPCEFRKVEIRELPFQTRDR